LFFPQAKGDSSMEAAPESPPPAPSFATVTFEPEPGTEVYGEKIETTLYRNDGGLGFSIAGGRGYVPYKGNDNVSTEGNPRGLIIGYLTGLYIKQGK